jgi:VanZ family protein
MVFCRKKQSKQKTQLNPWLWVALWMLIIFLFSTSTFSGENTSRIIGPILKWIIPDISSEAVSFIQFLFRKTAHVIEYAILAILLCNALIRRLIDFSQTGLIFKSVFICFIYAVFDEWHQSWSVDRIGSLMDVFIDTVGALFGTIIFVCVLNFKSKNI